MSPPSVLVTRRVPGTLLERLGSNFAVDARDSDSAPERDELLEAVAGRSAVVTMVTDRVDDEFLDAAGESLAVVANYAVGFDNIDLAAASRRGVLVSNTPGVLSLATAELTIALILALERRVGEGDRLLHAGSEWAWAPGWMVGRGLRGLCLGIIGLGRIGLEVARLARAHGMSIVYVRASGPADAPYSYVSLPELLDRADVVSVHCPLTPATHHLIGADELKQMRDDAVLINTARGPIVDEEALARAVEVGEIGGAALDVYEHEPQVFEGLRGRPNIILTPHLGSGTWETREEMGRLCAEAVEAVLIEHRAPSNALNPDVIVAADRGPR